MPEIIHKKVGVIACSGEERPGGTVTRLAAVNPAQDFPSLNETLTAVRALRVPRDSRENRP